MDEKFMGIYTDEFRNAFANNKFKMEVDGDVYYIWHTIYRYYKLEPIKNE